jgi:hypothetical protein
VILVGCLEIRSQRGNDSSESCERAGGYLLDCCLYLEVIEGVAQKFSEVRNRFENLENELHAVGVRHTSDMSAFLIDVQPSIKLIDFAVNNAYTETQNKMADGAKNRLSLQRRQ